MGWGGWGEVGRPCRDRVPRQYWRVCLQGRGLPANVGLRGSLPCATYHEARLHGGHERQLAAIPHAELLQLPELSRLRGGGRKEGEAMPPPRQGRDSEAESAGRAMLMW